jgi:hypothetical protein
MMEAIPKAFGNGKVLAWEGHVGLLGAVTPVYDKHYSVIGSLGEVADAERVVSEEGRFIHDRFQQRREHPAAKMIRDNKTLFCRIIREMGLDIQGHTESRPPRQY